MARALDNLPELYELIEGYLSVPIKVHCIEKLIRGNLAESDGGPVLLGLCAVDGLVTIFIENLEDLCNGLLELC